MTITGEQQQEQQQQQQQQTSETSRWDVQPDGNGLEGIDVTRRLQDVGANMRGESGDTEYPRMSNHYDGQEVIYKYNQNQI